MKPKGYKLFTAASTIPQFFNTNLVDNSRVIKIVSGRWCAIRAFYYQYLKLAFQLDVQNDHSPLQYSDLLLKIFKQSVDRNNNNNNNNNKMNISRLHNYISYVQELFRMLSNTEDNIGNFQQIIQNRRQFDQSLTQLLILTMKNKGLNIQNLPAQQTIANLCRIFDLNTKQIDKCIKFQQSDVFVYIQSDNQLYIAFLNLDIEQAQQQYSEQKNNTNANNSMEIDIYNNNNKHQIKDNKDKMNNYNKVVSMNSRDRDSKDIYLDKYKQDQKQMNSKKSGKANDTIINIFGDMLHSSKNDGTFTNNNVNDSSKFSNSYIINNLNNSLSPAKKQKQQQVVTSIKTGINNSQGEQKNIYGYYNNQSYNQSYDAQTNTNNNAYMMDRVQQGTNNNIISNKNSNNEYLKSEELGNKWKKSQSKVQKYEINRNNKQVINNMDDVKITQSVQNSQDQMIFRPAGSHLPAYLQSISEVTASKQSMINSNKYNHRRDPLDVAEQDEKGTFYRQFTNTRILNILPQPQRTTVKMLKNRFIGVHQRDRDKIKDNFANGFRM